VLCNVSYLILLEAVALAASLLLLMHFILINAPFDPIYVLIFLLAQGLLGRRALTLGRRLGKAVRTMIQASTTTDWAPAVLRLTR
jgi:hypothetical protein